MPGKKRITASARTWNMASNLPTKIGKYDVIDVIGRGGMGVVYKANDPHLDRTVAIKMITSGFSENPALLKRFFVEAKSLASLVHPNIVTVYDLGDFNGNPYLVMQYLEGEDLESALAARRQLSLLDKTNIIIQVCEGLSYAHQRNVIHRDIKPANIMLCQDSGIKIFDFGIAKMGDQNVTKTASQIMGTLYYMSPEQVNGQPSDGRTDLFSTGVVLYQLVTNRLPFQGQSTTNTLLKITMEPPPPLKDFVPVYPPELEAIVLRALTKDRERRYQSADEMAFDLRQMQGHLKQELIDHNMEEVAVLMNCADLCKAKDRLIQVLKIDQQNTKANQLLREVLGQIQRQEVNAQVTKLRERAEEALAQNQYPSAQECLDRALSLDKNNTELQGLREQVRQAAERAERLQQALKTAEADHSEGLLDTAKEAVEKALELAPDDAQAKALHRLIHRDWEERSRQRQMENFLGKARDEISARRFTVALEVLKEAQAIDPDAPQVQALLESATAGQEQERRRRELEALTREVEEALSRDDYRAACTKASEGLSRFPGERTLLRLQVLAEKQRQAEERKKFVDEQLAMARQLLHEKRNEELLKTLEGTLAEIGPEPRLQSLLSIVRENVERERREKRKADCLRKAGESVQRHAYDEALQILEGATKDLGDDADISEYIEKVRAERAQLVQGTIRRAQQQSSLDLRYQILEEALGRTPNEAELKEQFESVQRLGKLIASIASEARSLEEAQKYDEAVVKWETLRGTYRHYPDLEKNLERVKRLRDLAQVDERSGWLRKIESAMGASDYVNASVLVAQAEQEFPWDADLMELKERVEEALKLRVKAQKGLAEGQKLLASQKWEEGANAIVRACRSAAQDRMIQERGVNELVQAAKNAGEKNARAAEILLGRLAELQPSAVRAELGSKVGELKKEESAAEAKYPDEPRLLQERDEIQTQARKVEDEQGRERERAAESGAAHDKPGEPLETELFDPESPFAQARIGTDAPAARESLSAPLPEISTVTTPPAVAPEPVKTDAPAIHAVPSETELMAAGGTLAEDETMLEVIEKELAVYVGPMARIMVKRAAAKTTDTDELYGMLAKSLERDKDRAAFMARKTELMKSRLKVAVPQPQPAEPLTSAVNPVSALGITPEAVDHAARMLAAHVGPISGVLAKKAARKADSLQSLYRLLSEHVQNSKERRQFLRDAGFPET
jgi:eukaryotic-like serine/threonine-protein kinase